MPDSSCRCDYPQLCPVHRRSVYRADIEACKAGLPLGIIIKTTEHNCTQCEHCGPPVLDAKGLQIGAGGGGCGCSGNAILPKIPWFTCKMTGNPARQDKGQTCTGFKLR